MEIHIREGKKEDISTLLELIRELAVYEKAPAEVSNTEEQILKDGFGEMPIFKFWLAWEGKNAIAMAVVYFRYSTWKGKCLYLEDLYIRETHRDKGIGKKLFEVLLHYAKTEQCKRLNWQVLDWNEPAIAFYKKLGANLDAQWLNGTLEIEYT